MGPNEGGGSPVPLEDFPAHSVSNDPSMPKPCNEEENGETESDDYYDYESPYWAPADMKTELLNQFRKLRIPSVETKDIE